jgi:hypothetical protein
MSSVLQPIVSDLRAALNHLKVGVNSVINSADDSGVAIVMGPAGTAGMQTPNELMTRIKAGKLLGQDHIDSSSMTAVRKEVRDLMTKYADSVAASAVNEAQSIMSSTYILPVRSHSQSLLDQVDEIIASANALVKATSRIPGAGKMSVLRKQAIEAYEESQTFCQEIARKKKQISDQVTTISSNLQSLMFASGEDNATGRKVTSLQETRDSLEKENIYLEKQVLNHFKPGSMDRRSDVRKSEIPFEFPSEIEKGKGREFMKVTMAAVNSNINEFWYLMAIIRRQTSDFDPLLNTYFKPPAKQDGYASVPEADRDLYDQQAANLFGRLEAIIPRSIMVKVLSTFRHGKKDEEFQCAEGDGPSLIFSIIALYRPSGEKYRGTVEQKIYVSADRLKNGTSPTTWVSEMRPLVLECLELDIKLKWSMCGERIVSLMTEKSNTFSQKLAKFEHGASIADLDDCAVELDQVVSLIETGCESLEGNGMRVVVKANQICVEHVGDKKDCSYGMDCFRRNCTHKHPAGFVSKYDESKGGKGGKGGKAGKGKGKGGGKGGKGGKSGGKEHFCEAKDCPATSPTTFAFCKSCHRKGLESGSIVNKWNQTIDISKKSSSDFTKKQIKALKAAIETKETKTKKKRTRVAESDGEAEEEERSPNQRASAAIFQRLGKRGAPLEEKRKWARQAMLEVEEESLEAERQQLQARLKEIDDR